jgi:hypothetical protein
MEPSVPNNPDFPVIDQAQVVLMLFRFIWKWRRRSPQRQVRRQKAA